MFNMNGIAHCSQLLSTVEFDLIGLDGIVHYIITGLSAGEVFITYVGSKSTRLFSTSGQAVIDVNIAENYCEKGSIILSPSAWSYCPERKGMNVEKLEEGHVKVSLVYNI